MKNKIAVIGTINRDKIKLLSGRIIQSYGGILYNLIPLATMFQGRFEVYPFINMGRDCSREILKIIRIYPSINTAFSSIVPMANNHCHLSYLDQDHKKEILKGGVPPLKYADIREALACDLMLVNFISGRDIGLRALEKIRSNYRGLIYMDLHSLTLGKKVSGERFLRRPPNWKRYCLCADYLQMNRREFELLTRVRISPLALRDFFGEFERDGLKGLAVTLGKDGAQIVYKSGFNKLRCSHLPLPLNINVADTTGCGDIFGAVLAGNIMTGKTFRKSAQIALEQATLKCRFRGIENLPNAILSDFPR